MPSLLVPSYFVRRSLRLLQSYARPPKTGATVGRFNKVDFPDGTTMRDTQRGGDDGGRADEGRRN